MVKAKATATPRVHNRRTGAPLCLSSENFRVSPPSKRMIATHRPTTARRIDSPLSPMRKSSMLTPRKCPALNPKARRRRMDGSLHFQASHCARIPSPRTRVTKVEKLISAKFGMEFLGE